ncbi:hypothetical protein RMCBS344292_02649 [Rhizopus microsporus]|nr:hypothetical protein RMCBS344292_02649 [Rhizopus microsporus]
MVDSNENTQDDPLSAVLSQLASPDNFDPELQAVDDDQDMQDILDALLELQRLEGQEGDLFDQDNLTISYAISLNQELQREAERQVALIDQQMKLVTDRLNNLKAIARQESTCKHFRKSGYSQSIKKVLFFDENELLQNSDEESHDEESESSDEENDENADSLNNEGYRIARGWTGLERKRLFEAIHSEAKRVIAHEFLKRNEPWRVWEIDKMTPAELEAVPVNRIDWERVSSLHVTTRDPNECLIQWTTQEHPAINKKPWSAQESAKLNSLVLTHENLTWKINYLAAQVGEKTHMKTAIIAASRAKHQQIHNPNSQPTDTETLKEKLQNTRKLKLEHKLHQGRREIKSALKKSKIIETQKQIKKIKSAKAMEEKKDDEKESQKKVKPEDLPKLEKELDMLKRVDLEYLADKKIKSTLQKNPAFKDEELVKQVIDSIEINNKYPEDIDKLILSNIEARLLAHKSVVAEVQGITQSFISILKGDAEKIERKKAEELEKKRKAEEAKKRAAEANDEGQGAKRQKTNGKPNASSKFMDSLAEYDEKNDEFFKKIYEGETKKNRPGQRQRRK